MKVFNSFIKVIPNPQKCAATLVAASPPVTIDIFGSTVVWLAGELLNSLFSEALRCCQFFDCCIGDSHFRELSRRRWSSVEQTVSVVIIRSLCTVCLNASSSLQSVVACVPLSCGFLFINNTCNRKVLFFVYTYNKHGFQ